MGRAVLWWWLGRRHLAHHGARTLITTVGVAVGVAMLVAVQLLNSGLMDSLHGMLQRLTGGAQLVVGSTGNAVDQGLLDSVARVDGVAHVAPVLERVLSTADATDQFQLMGVDLLGDLFFQQLRGDTDDDARVLGDPVAFLNNPDAVLVSRHLADTHHLHVGSRWRVVLPQGVRTLSVQGVLEDQGAALAFGGSVAVMGLDAAQALLDCPGRVSRLLVATSDGARVADVRARVEAAVAGAAPVLDAAQLGAMGEGATALFRRGLWLGGLVALLVAMGITYNTVLISAAQRRKELGILRCLGATRGQVLGILASETAVVALAGSLLGVLLGWGLARAGMAGAEQALSSLFLPIRASAVQLDGSTALGAVVLGMVASLVAAAAPGGAAARAAPVESVQAGVADQGLWSLDTRWRLLLCAALAAFSVVVVDPDAAESQLTARGGAAAAAAFLAMLVITTPTIRFFRSVVMRVFPWPWGVAGRMALDNMERSIMRGAANVAALAASILTVVAFSSFLEAFTSSMRTWVDTAVNADLVILAADDLFSADTGELDGQVEDRVARVPGVARVEGMRIVQQPHGTAMIRIRSLNLASYLAHNGAVVVEGNLDAARLTDPAHPRVVVSETMARLHGLRVGSTLTLDSLLGPQAFHVDGIVVDYSSQGGVVMMDRAFYRRAWKDFLLTVVHADLTPGAHGDDVRKAILEQLSGAVRPTVWLRAQHRAKVGETLDGFFALSRLLVVVALAVGIMGVINTLQASVLDRRWEMAILRALGASRRQVAQMVVLESMLLSVCGLALGTAGGLLAARTIMASLMAAQTGWRLPFVTPWGTLGFTAALCVAASALAALPPARRVGQMRITQALAPQA